MADPFMGQIMQVGFNYAPSGWSTCQGQVLPVNQYTALFSLLGSTFGGNGSTNFQLPNLQGRFAVGMGSLQGGSTYVLGQNGGGEHVTLLQAQMPIHTHVATFTPTSSPYSASMNVSHKPATEASASAGDYLAESTGSGSPQIYIPAGSQGSLVALASGTVNVSGGVTGGTVTVAAAGASQPVPTLPPYLALMSIIAVQGIYPSRP